MTNADRQRENATVYDPCAAPVRLKDHQLNVRGQQNELKVQGTPGPRGIFNAPRRCLAFRLFSNGPTY